ncbi:MAG: hypothetical protein ACKOI2_06685 [Actinomycetota bacterium]
MPQIDARLPRRLASKRGLHELCLEHGVPTLPASFPANPEELERIAADGRFPLVAKNLEAFERRRAPVVQGSRRIDDARQLMALAKGWREGSAVILQDYLPVEESQDWIFNGYCDESSDLLVHFTGVKVRSSPPLAGMTSLAYSVPHPELVEMSSRFLKSIGYCGPLDLDWRYDRRSGRYYLLDFNPRIGAQFRAFETVAGVDVVRAMHLHLTGQAVPPGAQAVGRRYIVESAEVRFALATSLGYTAKESADGPTSTELAWLASDDPIPFFAAFVRLVARKLRGLGRRLVGTRQ